MRSWALLRDRLDLATSERFLIVAHDRGGAEVMADFAGVLEGQVRFATAGPARALFSSEFPDRIEVAPAEGLAWADTAIVSTGWQTGWELMAAERAQQLGLRVPIVLDNWVNFGGRFRHHGHAMTPGELWVVDERAAASAADEFPRALVRVLPWNLYDSVAEQLVAARRGRSPSDEGLKVLFLGENVDEFAATLGKTDGFGFDQFTALAHLASVLDGLAHGGVLLRVRPHPSEDPATYSARLPDFRPHVELSTGDLIGDLAWCDIAVGLSSVALYYATRGGIPVYTCFPNAGSDYHRSPWDVPPIEQFAPDARLA